MTTKLGVIKRDPFWALHKAILAILSGGVAPTSQTPYPSILVGLPPESKAVPVMDAAGVDKLTALPYVTIGDETTTSNDLDTKGGAADEITFQIHIWSRYNGVYEISFISDQVEKALTKAGWDLSA